jgi:hypothetical protein
VTKRRRLMLVLPALALLLGMVVLAGRHGLQGDAAGAQGIYGGDTCLYGFVWRVANDADHVCVSWDRRDEVVQENADGPGLKAPGSDFCVDGFVWREARPEDHVCVSPASRDTVFQENDTAQDRRAIDTYYDTWDRFEQSDLEGHNISLELSNNGLYTFKGEVHSKARFAIDYTVVCSVPTLDGRLMSISRKGSIHGTFVNTFVGSKWDDWNQSGVSAEIVNHWHAIDHGQKMRCDARADTSVGSILDTIQKGEKVVSGVVKVISWIA